MLASLTKLLALLNRRDRRNGLLLLLLMIAGAALEVVGIAAVPAFVSAVVSPEHLARFPAFQGVLQQWGLTTPETLVVWGAAALLFIFACKNAFLVLNYRLQLRYVANRRLDLAARLTRAYMRAPFTLHLTRNTSELLRNVDRETNIIATQVVGGILELMTHVTILVAVLAFLFVAEPWLTLWWMAAFGALGALGVLGVSQRLKRLGEREQEQRKTFVQALYQGFGSIKEARVLNREDHFARKVVATMADLCAIYRVKTLVHKAIGPATEFTAIAGLLVIVVTLVLMDRPTDGILVTLSLFVVGLVRLRQTVGAALTHLTGLRYSLVSVDSVHDDLMALEACGEPRDRQGPKRRLTREIVLKDIWFAYDSSPGPVLKGIDLTIPAGSAVAFVGSTGAGKSTLVDVILGLLTPQRGAVLVDGVDIRAGGATGGVGAWQRSIGYVPQSIYLLDDTVRRNVALGLDDGEIDEGRLWTAIRTAQLEGLVARLPAGLDTAVGEHGVRLSGGERQRIGIARALYHDPDVLILDEATSSLDTATERAIVQAVEALKGDRTVITIAHRLSTVRNCDTLYFLKDGKVEAAGDFAGLQQAHDDFRLMAAG